jgi:cephalosporin-C deacetylase-like acetyl esterase
VRQIAELLGAAPRAEMLPSFILSRVVDLEHRPQRRSDDEIRGRLRDALGIDRLPREDAQRSIGTIDRGDFVIEKLVYEATPGLPVPAHLYLPADPGPHPAVVHPPGHWMENAKIEVVQQQFNAHLARNGVAVLVYDTLGQGERRVGWHQHGQLAPLLAGFTSIGLMVRDSLAALDLLAARADIDASRLGMTGTSGGGWSTMFAAALDERITVAAIACIVNTHLSQMRDAGFGTGWDGWTDLCIQLPGICDIGTIAEIYACVAPRALRIVHAREDPPFPLAGAREVAGGVAELFAARGAGDAFSFVDVPGGHGLHPAVRGALSEEIVRRLRGAEPTPERDVELLDMHWEVPHNLARAERPMLKRSQVSDLGYCLPEAVDTNGPVVTLARELAAQARTRRAPLTRERLQDVIGPFPDRVPLRPYVTNHIVVAGGSAQRLTLESEPGITLDALLILADNWSENLTPVLVVLDEGGKAQALRSPEAETARMLGWGVFLPDLRGTGESAASEFEQASAAWMLDRDLLNQRVWDTLRAVDHLSERYSSSQQIDKSRLAVWGIGAFGLVALVAAALDPRIAACGATDLASLESLLVPDSTVTPMAYRHGLLEHLDVGDLVQLMEPRPAVAGIAPDGLETAIRGVLEAA